jgi:hypothetical protein
VVVHDLDVVRITFTPQKADTPLIVDADTVLAIPVTVQRFEPIARRRRQVPQLRRAVQLPQLSSGYLLDGLKSPAAAAMKQPLGFLAAKRLNHKFSLCCCPLHVKR